jgi:hypothetical protein
MVTLFRTGSSTWGSWVWGAGAWGVSSFSLPATLTFRGDDQDVKFDTWEHAFGHGGASEGDEIKSKQVTVSGKVWATSRASGEALVALLKHECAKPNQRLSLDGGATYIKVAKLKSFDPRPRELSDRTFFELTITWRCDDPFWYGSQETRSFSPIGNTLLSVDAMTGLRECRFGQSPVITITAPSLSSVPSVTLTNLSDESLQIRYSDPLLRNGASVAIDCYNGTVTRSDGSNTIQYFEGEWLRLLGVDSIQYQGLAASISFSWPHRWI